MLSYLALGLIPPMLTAGGAWWFFFRRDLNNSNQSVNLNDPTFKEISDLNVEIRNLIPDPNLIASKLDLEVIDEKYKQLQKEQELERDTLKKIEATLEGAQKEVEQKELEQQEFKISQKDEEQRTENLRIQFEKIQLETAQLEQNLSESLQDLQNIINELEEGSKIRTALEELSRSLEEAMQLLRELYLEYKVVNERVQMITRQQAELEEEYTRLVEQQLAGG
jgi:hypothetical protein